MKSEPETYSILDLKRDRKTLWEGVRNYQARNFMQKEMRLGDHVLFYHSSTEPPGVAGLARVSAEAVPDPSQFQKKSDYFDPKATPDKPIWYCVEVAFERVFQDLLPLDEIRAQPKLKEMPLLQRGQRLSVQPVTEAQFKWILHLRP